MGNRLPWLAVGALWIAVAALGWIVYQELGDRRKQYPVASLALVLALASLPAAAILTVARPYSQGILSLVHRTHSQALVSKNGCTIFPADNVWNTPIRDLPVDPHSAEYIRSMGPDLPLHADFGPTGGYEYSIVNTSLPAAEISFKGGAAESDAGAYRLPDSAPIEKGSDKHVLVVDEDKCALYELFGASHNGSGEWEAQSGAIFDLRSNRLRPYGWTSADAAGLPMFPGLVRFDEVEAGAIRHALRFTTRRTQRAFVWPGRHRASRFENQDLPPMGQRFRLRASYDTSAFSSETQVILKALQQYGMFLADNGGPWYLSGAMDSRWPGKVISEMRRVRGADFEAVDSTPLIFDTNSAQARTMQSSGN